MHPSRLRLGPSQSRPLTDASPGSARSPGLRVCQSAPSRRRNIRTHAPFRTECQSFLRCRDMSLLAGGALQLEGRAVRVIRGIVLCDDEPGHQGPGNDCTGGAPGKSPRKNEERRKLRVQHERLREARRQVAHRASPCEQGCRASHELTETDRGALRRRRRAIASSRSGRPTARRSRSDGISVLAQRRINLGQLQDFRICFRSIGRFTKVPANDGLDGAPNGISVLRWSLSKPHLKGSRPWASLSGI
jgi:hypothetical protein